MNPSIALATGIVVCHVALDGGSSVIARNLEFTNPTAYLAVDDPILQRKRVACGPNVLYMLLKSFGIPCDYKDLEARLPIQSQGCTLLALQDTARCYELNTRALRCTASDLKYLKLPAIAHFYKSVFFGEDDNHYVLLTKVWDDRIEYIDGTSGWHEAITFKKFAAVSHGYILACAQRSDLPWFSFVIPLGILVSGFCVLRHSSKTKLQNTLLIFGVIVLIVIGNTRGVGAHSLQTSTFPILSEDDGWRSRTHDAINVLDLYFKVVHYPEDRAKISQYIPKHERVSLVELAQAANDLGIPLRIVRPALSGLQDLSFPIIVHMFDDKEQNGGYYLLLRYGANGVQVVNAAVATVESYSVDEFRRRWSGYALVRENGERDAIRVVGISILGFGIYLFIRFRRMAKRNLTRRAGTETSFLRS